MVGEKITYKANPIKHKIAMTNCFIETWPLGLPHPHRIYEPNIIDIQNPQTMAIISNHSNL